MLILQRGDIVPKLSQQRSKEGRTVKLDLGNCLLVCIDYIENASSDFRVCGVSVKWEAVGNTTNAHVVWNSTETENWEAPIEIVWLDDATHIHKRLFVLVGARTHVMEGIRQSWVTIASSVVDCSNK